jgi:Skp family chaperone for outer membrane proteins
MNKPGMRPIFMVMLLCASFAHAQTQRSGGGGESQKIMQQYQQLAAEKTSLQAQVAQMKKDLDAANTELAAVKKERDALKTRSAGAVAAAAQLAQANASRQNAEKSLEQTKQRTAELVDRFKETVGTLKGVESNRNELQKTNLELTASYDKCAIDNTDLYDITNSVLTRYEHVGLFTKVSDAEPFTRITRTRIDNLVDEYRSRAQELRVKKPAS